MTTPAPTPSLTVEGFSLSHAQIMDGTETFIEALKRTNLEGWKLYGVNEASMEPDTDSFDNEGDDQVLSTWGWFNFLEVEVQAGFLTMRAVSNLTGDEIEEVQASGTGASATPHYFAMDLWTESSLNMPPRPMLVRMPAKDQKGNPRSLIIGLYKVQFGPIGFEGPEYKEGMKVNYTGKALMSDSDEKGVLNAGGKKRIARALMLV